MKSKVTNIIDYRSIPVPLEMLQIEIPSWEDVAKPLVDQAMRQYEEESGEYISSLTDEMVQSLNLPGMTSVHQLKQYGMELFSRTQKEYRFYHEILPFILKFYQENSNTIINSDERDYYIEAYIEKVDDYAQDAGMDLENYVAEELKLSGDPIDALEKQALEDFTFKLIAQTLYFAAGYSLDETTYEAFIQDQVINQEADEIEVRQKLSYENFKDIFPEKILVDEIYQYYYQEMEFIINPNITI